ncbi:mannosyltransferase putative-domain-containing protein [Chytriomyces cf. hyalinus JEL632]|nr:mannosyltransferase putative-domain-containing protein [Chytriomyces cf. hyalinus JEL632]
MKSQRRKCTTALALLVVLALLVFILRNRPNNPSANSDFVKAANEPDEAETRLTPLLTPQTTLSHTDALLRILKTRKPLTQASMILTDAQKEQQNKWSEYRTRLGQTIPDELEVDSNDARTGISIMGGASPQSALAAVKLAKTLKYFGCNLPIEYTHIESEPLPNYLKWKLANASIQVRSFSAPTQWSNWHLELGAAKPTSILTSPFDRVLFLDPDVLVVRDPASLFQSVEFRKSGALFWTDFRATARDNVLWAVMGFDFSSADREWDSGVIVVDKRRRNVMLGLKMAEHFCMQSWFYFDLFWGDKEAFRWGFAVTSSAYKQLDATLMQELEYHVNMHSSHSVGSFEVEALPDHFRHSETGHALVPFGKTYCGRSFVHWDLVGREPLFIHMTRLKKVEVGERPFLVGQRYVVAVGRSEVEFDETRCGHVAAAVEHCCALEPGSGLEVEYYDFSASFPHVHEAYQVYNSK